MTPRADVAAWAAVVRLRRATRRYVRELLAAMPAVAALTGRYEQVAYLADVLVEATDLPPSMGSVMHLEHVLREVELPRELFIEE